jgi:hypothetical protein
LEPGHWKIKGGVIMKLQKKIIEVLEANGWVIRSEPEKQGEEYYVEISHDTPAGEDWVECIWYDGTINGFFKGVRKNYMNFDIDEDVELWIYERGKRGVSNSVRALLENAEYKALELENLDGAFMEVVK